MKLKEALAGGAWSGNGKLEVLSQLMRLRQICCDPALCFEDYTGESAKLETCVSLIASASAAGHKILLFPSLPRCWSGFGNAFYRGHFVPSSGRRDPEGRTQPDGAGVCLG
ncbi:MAG: hypothetical protein ACLTR6_15810 [Clostridium fessum]